MPADLPSRAAMSPSLDVVVPFLNEEPVLDHLLQTLSSVFSREKLAAHGLSSVRFIMVDDGSSDRSVERVLAHIRSGMPIKLVRLTRNFGHQNALCAGLDRTSADLVAVIDADLQDPPELIFEMISLWRQGWDVVYGQRRKRKENVFKRVAYWSFYRLIGLLSDIRLPRDAGDFGLMDQRVMNALRQLPERLRYVRGLRSWVGFRQTGLPYDRPERHAGSPQYGLRQLYELATDGIASMTIRPLRFIQTICACSFLLTLVVLAVVILKLLSVGPDLGLSFGELAIVLVVTMFAALNMLATYILGAYVGRTYLETKNRPSYLVLEEIDPSSDQRAQAIR
jgi:dolichol-phosphate mannosyltransferase